MRISQVGLSICVLAISSYLFLPPVDAQVEYGTSAAAGVMTDIFADADSDLNLDGTLSLANAELVDVVAAARAEMNKVSARSAVTRVPDSDALTYDTFSWDTFDVTSSSIPNGTATTVTFWIGLDATLRASSGSATPSDVVSLMVVDVYTVTPGAGVPTADTAVFVGTANLDAVLGFSAGNDLAPGDFTVQAVSGGYTATLNGFQTPIDIATTVSSQISIRFRVQTGASVAAGLTDAVAVADLQDSLELIEIETEAGVDISRASGAPVPPVPLHVAPVLVIALPIIGAVLLARRSRTSRGWRRFTA
jgi:hypothetical protein